MSRFKELASGEHTLLFVRTDGDNELDGSASFAVASYCGKVGEGCGGRVDAGLRVL